MSRFLRKTWVWALCAMWIAALPVSTFGEQRYTWRTAADVREGLTGSIVGTVSDTNTGRNEITILPDDDRTPVLVVTDAVSTVYNGFGGLINGQPEIFTGSKGFPNVRVGDRIEAHGVARRDGEVLSDSVTLLGRKVEAGQVGVGNTRTPDSVSTPTAGPISATATNPVEGVVRTVNRDSNFVVIETDQRRIITVRGTNATPVYYRGETYQLRNLEVGDRIRVDADPGSISNGDLRARSISVTRSVQEAGNAPTDRSVASLSGRVTRIDRARGRVTVDSGRGEQTVELGNATDGTGRRVRAADMQVGDVVDMTGTYSNDVFLASTVRFNDETAPPPANTGASGDVNTESPRDMTPLDRDYVTVTIYGTVTESLHDAPMLAIRDRESDRTIRVMVAEDFVVRTRGGSYVTADAVKDGDVVTIKAYRDRDGNYVAQTIRIR